MPALVCTWKTADLIPQPSKQKTISIEFAFSFFQEINVNKKIKKKKEEAI